MGFGKVLKEIPKVGQQIGTIIGVPGMTLLDDAIDVIKASAANDHEKEAALTRINILKSLPVAVDPVNNSNLMDSKRVKMTFVNIAVIVAVNIMAHFGLLGQNVADYVCDLSTVSTGLHVAMETIRPSGTERTPL